MRTTAQSFGIHEGEVKFRASSAHNLVAGYKEWTADHEGKLTDLEMRKAGQLRGKTTSTGKPGAVLGYSENNAADHAKLLQMKADGAQLGEGAKSLVRALWLKLCLGYDEGASTGGKETIKGNMLEAEACALLDEVQPIPQGDRIWYMNTEKFVGKYYTGTPDILYMLPDLEYGEDIKIPWSVRQFMEKAKVSELYFAQMQVYMHLTGAKSWAVHFCLMSVPYELIQREIMRTGQTMMLERGTQAYEAMADQLEINLTGYEERFTPEQRVRTFSMTYDPAYMARMDRAAQAARDYFFTLSLEEVDEWGKIGSLDE